MTLRSRLRGKLATIGQALARADLSMTDKAVLLAQRSLAVARLDTRFVVDRHLAFELRDPPKVMRGLRDLVIRTAAARDLAGVCAVNDTPPALIHERLDRGDLVYVGELDGRVLCHVWFHRGPTPFVEDAVWLARWALTRTTFWSYDAAACDDARRSGIFVKVFQRALRDAFELHGADRIQCMIRRHNTMSIAVHERLGFQRLGGFAAIATPWGRSLRWHGNSESGSRRIYLLGAHSPQEIPLPP